MYISAIDSVFCILYTYSSDSVVDTVHRREKGSKWKLKKLEIIHFEWMCAYTFEYHSMQSLNLAFNWFRILIWFDDINRLIYNWIQQRATPEQWCDLLNFGWNNGMTAPFFWLYKMHIHSFGSVFIAVHLVQGFSNKFSMVAGVVNDF